MSIQIDLFVKWRPAGLTGNFSQPRRGFRVIPFDHYRKHGSASYIVREVHSARERERDTERERKTEVTSPLSR